MEDNGAPLRDGLSSQATEPEVSALRASIPSADFTHQNMLGYGFAAYCAGWTAAVKACTGKTVGGSDVYDWLSRNPPSHLDEPIWAFGRPAIPAQAIEAGTAKTEGLGPKDESAVHAPKPNQEPTNG